MKIVRIPTGQFVLVRSEHINLYADYSQSHWVSDWALLANTPTAMVNSAGRRIGWIVGVPIDDTGVLEGSWNLNCRTDDWGMVEDELARLAGRWAAVIEGADGIRFYLDAGGTMAAVYSSERGVLASTPSLIADGGPELPPQSFYAAGLTPWSEIKRLLPNHSLELGNWVVRRHWPRPGDNRLENTATSNTEIDDLVSLIAVRLRHIMVSVANAWPAYVGITAGRDSRMMLAAIADSWESFRFITMIYLGKNGRIDEHGARKVARLAGVPHTFQPIAPVTDQRDSNYLEIIGYCGGSKARFRYCCKRYLDCNGALLWGIAGGVGRAYYWKKGTNSTVSAASCLRLLDLPIDNPAQQAMEGWLREVQGLPMQTQLDLLYIENRLGAWAGPHFYGYPFATTIGPFCDRQIFDAMLQLPADWRSAGRLAHQLVSRFAPALATVPYQQYTGFRRVWSGVLRRILRTARIELPDNVAAVLRI